MQLTKLLQQAAICGFVLLLFESVLAGQDGNWRKQIEGSVKFFCRDWNTQSYAGKIKTTLKSRQYESTFSISPDKTGEQIRFQMVSSYKMPDGRSVVAKKGSMNISKAVVYAEELVITNKEGETSNTTHVRAQAIDNGKFHVNFEFVGYLLGISELDSQLITKLLRVDDCEFIGSSPRPKFRFLDSRYGEILITLEGSAPFRIHKMRFMKSSNHHIVLPNLHPLVGDNQINPGEHLKRMVVEVGPIAYADDGKRQGTVTFIEDGDKGTNGKRIFEITLQPANHARLDDYSDIILFDNLKIPERTRIHVFGEQNIRFEIGEGGIKKVLDKSSIDTLRKLKPSPDKEPSEPKKGKQNDSDDRLANDTGSTIRRDYIRTIESGAHCGVYSLMGALSSLGVDYMPERLLSQEFVDRPQGSSAHALVKAAAEFGVDSVVASGLSPEYLKNVEQPVLLLLEKSHTVEGTNHWITYLGDSKGKALILDLPRDVQEVEYPMLLTQWKGVGVVVGCSNSPIWAIFCVSIKLFLTIVLTFTCIVIMNKFSNRSRPGSIGRFVAFKQALLLMLLAILFAAGLHLSNFGFAKNPNAVCLASERYGTDEYWNRIKEVELSESMIGEDVQIIDARLPHAYSAGHIPTSINFPVDASIAETSAALSRIGRDIPTIVYCEGKGCEWDRHVASRLVRLGWTDIAIYDEGWRGWSSSVSQ